MMRVSLNGRELTLPDGASVRDVIASLDMDDAAGVAVAVNGTIVPRSDWEGIRLSEGQKVEIVRAVQGG